MVTKPESKIWRKQIFFTLVEHGLVRVLDALITLTLIRTIPTAAFGLFTVYQSWVMMLLIFLPSIEFVLIRDYQRLKTSGQLHEELHIYKLFNNLRLFITALLVGSLALIPQQQEVTSRLALLALAFALPFSQSYFSFLREPLRLELKQRTIALLSALQRFLILMALLIGPRLFPEKTTYVIYLSLLTYFITGALWQWAWRQHFKELPKADIALPKALNRVWTILITFVLWIHINGIISQSVQTLDVFFLNFFKQDINEIALYGISLKAANFFQIVPMALTNSFGIFLARNQGKLTRNKEDTQTLKYTFGFILLAALMFGFSQIISEPFLSFVAKGKLDATGLLRIQEYFKWHVIGILMLCLSFPVGTYVSARLELKPSVLQIALPWAVLACGIFYYAASQSALLVAQMNVVVYFIFNSLLLRYWRTH